MTPDHTVQERWIRNRDPDAFTELVSRHASMVYSACMRVLGNRTDAEEVSQECFLELAGKKTVVKPSLAGWLYRVAVYTSLNRIRSESRRKKREERFMRENGAIAEPEWDDVKPHLDEAIAALPDKLRDPLVLRFFEGHTHEAIAERVGVSRSTVQYRINKGVERIRRSLRRRGIVASGAALTALMASAPSEAAPVTLIASLGEQALAGYAHAAASGAAKTALTGGVIMVKKAVVGLIAAILLVAGILAVTPLSPWEFKEAGQGVPEPLVRTAEVDGVEAGRSGDAATLSLARTQDAESDLQAASLTEPSAPAADDKAAASDEPEEEETKGEPEDDETRKLEPPASISGTVMDEAAYPIAGASVRLEATDHFRDALMTAMYETSTDSSGYYEILGIEALVRYYAASADAPGYRMETRTVPPPSPGAHLANVDFTLPRGEHFIRGRVVTEEREAVPGAQVEMLLMRDQRPQPVAVRRGSRLAFTITDETGHFELAAMNEGLCDLSVLKEGYPTTIFPRLPVGSDPVELVLSGATGSIAGTVTLPDDTPAAGYGLGVSKNHHDGGPGLYEYRFGHSITETDADGGYQFDGLSPTVSHGVYLFRGELGEGTYLDVRDDVRVKAGEVTRVDFVARPKARLVGRVTYTDGSPIDPNFEFRACEATRQGREVGVPQQFDRVTGHYEMEVHIREGDNTTIMIHACYFFPERFRPIDARPSLVGDPVTVEVAAGEEKRFDFAVEPPLTIPVRAMTEDEKLLGNMTVGIGMILPDGRKFYRYPSVGATDDAGLYVCRGPSAGQTHFVWISSSAENVFDPATMLAESGPITGQPGETVQEVVLIVENRGGIEGILTDDVGTPLADTEVEIVSLSDDGASRSLTTRTDETGYFSRIRAFPPGYCQQLVLTTGDPGHELVTIQTDIEIIRDAVVDLGTLPLEPVTRREVDDLPVQ